MKNYFVYDGIADRIFCENGFRAKYTGRIGGVKLMFAAMHTGKPVYPAMYADDNTVNDWIEGTLWEVDDEIYTWLNNGIYGDYRLLEGLQFESNTGELIPCDTCVLPIGIFALPDEVILSALFSYYDFYGLDPSLIEKAYTESEKEVSSSETASD